MKDNFTVLDITKIKPRRISLRKGRWSVEQQIFGRNWRKIQSYVRSRSLLQIRSHAQKYFMMQHKIEKRKKKVKSIVKQQMIQIPLQSENVAEEIVQQINKYEHFERSTFTDLQINPILSTTYQYSRISVPQTHNYTNQNIYPNIQLFSNPCHQMLVKNFQPLTYMITPNILPNKLPFISNQFIGHVPYFISKN